MRYWYDTEFIEDGKTVDLISIGIVAEDGRELYLVNGDAPWDRITRHGWLRENVVPYLPVRLAPQLGLLPRGPNLTLAVDWTDPAVHAKQRIAAQVADFLLFGPGQPELWAYYAAYDHVALCQLWGTMMDLPPGVPMWTNDIRQWQHQLGVEHLPEQAQQEHVALYDARHARKQWQHLEQVAHGPAYPPENITVTLSRSDLDDIGGVR